MEKAYRQILDNIDHACKLLESKDTQVEGVKYLGSTIQFADQMLTMFANEQNSQFYQKVLDIRTMIYSKYIEKSQQFNIKNDQILFKQPEQKTPITAVKPSQIKLDYQPSTIVNHNNSYLKQINQQPEELKNITFYAPESHPKLFQLSINKGLKLSFQQTLIYPLQRPDLFTGNRKPVQSILLFGPSGTGKTFITKCAAAELNVPIIYVKPSDLFNKYVGESEKQLAKIFNYSNQFNKSILFLDEVDSFLGKRGDGENEASRRVKTEFLQLTDGVNFQQKNSILIAATNRPQDLDDAVKRRFEERIYVPLPELTERQDFLIKELQKDEHKLKDTDFKEMAKLTVGYNFSDLAQLIKRAAMNVLKGKDINKISKARPITLQDFRDVITGVKPSNDMKQIKYLENWINSK